MTTLKEKLQHYEVNENGCWEWQGYQYKGYGQLGHNYKKYWVHRAAYQEYVGPLVKGMMICHKCDNPICINPDHLYQGTALDNNRDRAERNPDSGPYLYQVNTAKKFGMSVDDVRFIYTNAPNETTKDVLNRHPLISRHTAQRIRNGSQYKRLLADVLVERDFNPRKYNRTEKHLELIKKARNARGAKDKQ